MCVGVSDKRYSHKLILEQREFTINVQQHARSSSGTGSLVYFRMLILDSNVLMLSIGVYDNH